MPNEAEVYATEAVSEAMKGDEVETLKAAEGFAALICRAKLKLKHQLKWKC